MKKALIIAALTALLPACSPTTADDVNRDLGKAEYALDNGDTDDAGKICDKIINAQTTLNVAQLCRLARIYVAMSESGDEQDANLATAARCLEAAIETDADSVAAFMRSLPTEEQGRIAMLSYLTSTKKRTDADIDSAAVIESGHENPDSL